MRRLFTLLAVMLAAFSFVSCDKGNEVLLSYYRYDSESRTIQSNLPGHGITNTDAIVKPLTEKIKANNNMYRISDDQAIAEWNSFVNSIDDSKVVFGTDDEYYKVSFVKVNVKEKGEFESESVIVKTVGTKTWKKSGAK